MTHTDIAVAAVAGLLVVVGVTGGVNQPTTTALDQPRTVAPPPAFPPPRIATYPGAIAVAE